MKLKLKLEDPQTRAVWETVQQAKKEVAGWPAWKRGEEPASTTAKPEATMVSPSSPPPKG